MIQNINTSLHAVQLSELQTRSCFTDTASRLGVMQSPVVLRANVNQVSYTQPETDILDEGYLRGNFFANFVKKNKLNNNKELVMKRLLIG